jgi:hypothetical protein
MNLAVREAFEKECDDYRAKPYGSTKADRLGDSYRDPKDAHAWHYWQASRASAVLVVDGDYYHPNVQASMVELGASLEATDPDYLQ